MRYILIILFISASLCKAQPSNYRAFTVNDGLPSNNVYRCMEDNKGFLWVSTDAGVARFDGRHFQVFGSDQGLPDNDVIDIMKENNGRIWVDCFKQSPTYFDEVKNRFINVQKDPKLAIVPDANHSMFCSPLISGGVEYYNTVNAYIFRNGQVTTYPAGKKSDIIVVAENPDGSITKLGTQVLNKHKHLVQLKLYQYRNGTYTDSIALTTVASNVIYYQLKPGKFYVFKRDKGLAYIASGIKTRLGRARVDSIKIRSSFMACGVTGNDLYLADNNGLIHFFDDRTLRPTFNMRCDFLTNSVYRDKNENLWIATADKGLLFFRQTGIKPVTLPPNYNHTNFLSIAHKQNGAILAGNINGEVIEAARNHTSVHRVARINMMARQRKIIVKDDIVYTISDAGCCFNYQKFIPNFANSALPILGKTGILYSNDVLMIGLTTAIAQVNTHTRICTTLNTGHRRITAMANGDKGMIYFGSTTGLFRYDPANEITFPLNRGDVLSSRIAGICTTADGLVWAATAAQGIAVLQHDRLLQQITKTDGISDDGSRCIAAGPPGQIWLGTAQGISRINYRLQNGRLYYHVANFTRSDGLTDNIINELLCEHDTVFAATANGVSIMPANLPVSKFDIPVQLTGASINQRDTTLARVYRLDYGKQNIHLQFAGVDISGHFRNLQYTLDKSTGWTNLPENTLNIQLSTGSHSLRVRAVDVNGNTGSHILSMAFIIATPFWLSAWFWIITAFTVQAAIIYLINRRQKRHKEDKLARQIARVQTAALEQQAFTSLMNPHFMFNALNSIQHYINLHDRQNTNRYLSDFASLIRKNFEAAQQSFIPLEQELENIRIYLGLEQMRFGERFSYELIIAGDVEPDDWMIPTMILQPLLENALLHGIMPSAIKGEISVIVKKEHIYLSIAITDNGIGLENSAAIRSSRHKSRGTELIKKRIAALSGFSTSPINMYMSPVSDDKKNPGNCAVLTIPPDLYDAWLSARRA
jgi:ligand-binding sensor domain-containing protein